MRVVRVILGLLVITVAISCQQVTPPAATPATPAATAGPAPQPYGTLAEVMRGIPFPSSNIIFDTQSNDPGAPRKPSSSVDTQSATSTYSTTYGGWQSVEQSAIALSETANLIMIAGRKCENGLDVPLNDATFKKAAEGLVAAGQAAYKAAKTKNQDMMVEVSGTVSDACLACHEKYRDVPQGKMRCVPVP